jgi:serine/threonine-protein kinase
MRAVIDRAYSRFSGTLLLTLIGTKLAHYEITSHLGSGGMGDVYQATDTKLSRSVAIKLLPAAFASDAERLSRFSREAQTLASLNHPNIAQIYGIEESGDTRCIVMELVQGETLQARIQRGAIPVNEALKIAKQIAEAFEAAHDRGIIHRDLKPGNVMLTEDGKIKVLDFGLAKAYNDNPSSNANLSNSPTMMSMAGTTGIILGTAAYMSPEQAKGRAVDRRTDIFAFGCVLYEMLTGKRAFDGDDVTDILGAVLRIEPDWTQLPQDLPAGVGKLVRLCLQKNPKNRRSDATDVRLDIEQIEQDPGPAAQVDRIVKAPMWKRAVPVVLALIVGGVITGAAIWKLRAAPTLTVTRFIVTLPEGQNYTNNGRSLVAISPDGTQMVYVANQRLYHRNLSELDARPIPGTETWGSVLNPVFSPDGRSIVFAAQDRTLKKIAVTGGATVTLGSEPNNIFGMSWGEGGIVFGAGIEGILKVSENGGKKPELLVKVETGELAHGPQILPGGESILYTASTGQSIDEWDKAKIYVQPLKGGGPRKLVVDGGTDGRYIPTGHIVYAYQGTLYAVPFELKRLQVTGGPAPVVEGVRRAGGGNTGTAQYSFSQTGSLIYISGPVSVSGTSGAEGTLAAIDLKGGIERLKLPAKTYAFPRVSPDGKLVAVSTDGKDANVWIVDLSGATAPRQLTLGGTNQYPVWSADSKRVAFQSDREGDRGIFWQNADGTGTAERLTKPEQGTEHIPDSWSTDNKRFSYTAAKGRETAVWIFDLQDKKSTVFAAKAGALIGRSTFSPDGQWLAYQSNETGTAEIFVQPFPATGAKYPVVKPAGWPFWSPDGRALFFNPGPNRLESVGITTKPTFSFKPPESPPGGLMGLRSRNPGASQRVWDFTPDGKHIIGPIDTANAEQASTTSTAAPINVVLNWFEDLKQRVPGH